MDIYIYIYIMNCVPPETTNNNLASSLKISMVLVIKLTEDGEHLN